MDGRVGLTEPDAAHRRSAPERAEQPEVSAKATEPSAARGPRSAASILALQRGAGNRAVTLALAGRSAAVQRQPSVVLPGAAEAAVTGAAGASSAAVMTGPVEEELAAPPAEPEVAEADTADMPPAEPDPADAPPAEPDALPATPEGVGIPPAELAPADAPPAEPEADGPVVAGPDTLDVAPAERDAAEPAPAGPELPEASASETEPAPGTQPEPVGPEAAEPRDQAPAAPLDLPADVLPELTVATWGTAPGVLQRLATDPPAALRPTRTSGGPTVQRFGEGLLDGLRQRVSALTVGLRSGWESIRGRATGVFNQVREAAGAAVNRVRQLGSELVGGLQQAWAGARAAISGATDRFRQLVGGALAVLSDPIGALRRAVTTLDLGSLTGIVGRLLSVVNGLGGRVAAAGRVVREAVGAAWTRLSGLASAAGRRLSELAGSAVSGVRSLASSLTAGLGSAWSGLTNRAGQIGRLASGALGFASGLVERLLGGARSLWSGCQNAWSALSARFAPAADTAGAQVSAAGPAASAGLAGATGQVRAGHQQAEQQATGLVDRVTGGVSGLVGRIRSVPWAAALSRAGEAVPVLRQVETVIRDPEGAVEPHARGVAEKVHSELPGESRRVLTQHMQEQGIGAEASGGPVVQRQHTGEERSTDLGSIFGNLWHVLGQKLSGLSVGFLFQAVMQLIKDLIWPIPVVWAEIRGLGSDLVAFAGQFYVPRNPITDPLGCLHDVWSNLMTLVDLPIILVRRLSTMGLALMGWVTLILTLAGAFLGAGAGTLVGGVASALASFGIATPAGAVGGGVGGGVAGAGAGFGTAMALGEGLVIAFVAAHVADLVKSLLDLATVRQTLTEKADDYNQAADSGISLAVVGVLLIIGWFGARFATRIAARLARVMPPRLVAAAEEFAGAASRRRPGPPPNQHDTPPVRDPNRTRGPDETSAPDTEPVPDPAVLTGWRLKLQLLQTRVAALRQRYAASGATDTAVDAEITRLENAVQGMANRLQAAGRAEELPGFGRELRTAERTAYDLEQRVDRLVPGPAPSAVQQQLAGRLGMDPRTIAGFLDDAQCQRILDLINTRGIVGDRLAGLRNFVQQYAARGRDSGKLMELLDTEWPELRQMLDDRARVTWEPNWRGRPRIENGNANEGWQHIDERHVTGNAPEGPGDLFAPGTTRAEIQAAAEEVVANGTRLSRSGARMQTFEHRVTVHGRSDNVRVTVDASDGRVITAFPVRGG